MSTKKYETRHTTMIIFLAAGIALLLFGENATQYLFGGGLIFVGVLASLK